MSELLERIRRELAEATPAPWTWTEEEFEEGSATVWIQNPTGSLGDPILTETLERDAALIVSLRNHAGVLLAVCEAAELVASSDKPDTPSDRALSWLRAAVAALREVNDAT